MSRTHTARRRSAAQWAQLLADWDPDTITATDFARRLGVSRHTLAWWRSRLRRSSLAAGCDPSLRLVQLDVDDAAIPRDAADAWEFVSPDGHTRSPRGAGPQCRG